MACKSCSPCCAPLVLRLALGVIFVWAGAIKVATTMPVKGDDAAILANMGVIAPPAKPAAPAATPGAPKTTGSSAAPNPAPETPKTQGSRPVPSEPVQAAQAIAPTAPTLMSVIPVGAGGKTYTAEDFPDEVQVKPLYTISAMLKKAASSLDAEGRPVKPIWPEFLAHDRWPVYMGWACALTELLGGAFILLGCLTRFWAFALACVMGTAMWLTVFGPAIASGNTQLGVFPNYPWSDGMAWHTFQFQFVLLMVALAVMGVGPGRMAVDRVLFPPPPPPAPKNKPENAPAH